LAITTISVIPSAGTTTNARSADGFILTQRHAVEPLLVMTNGSHRPMHSNITNEQGFVHGSEDHGVINMMKLPQPTYDELLQSAQTLKARIDTLEGALLRIRSLSTAGTWPSWEMGMIARDALGISHEREHQRLQHEIANQY
jgi:hypothetical protein